MTLVCLICGAVHNVDDERIDAAAADVLVTHRFAITCEHPDGTASVLAYRDGTKPVTGVYALGVSTPRQGLLNRGA
jgi:hypothetical protein